MIGNLQALGLGIVGLGVIIGIGIVVLYNLAGTVADCPASTSWNASGNVCAYTNGSSAGSPSGAAYDGATYVYGQLGQSGLAGWIPAIIALVVGGLFLAYFGGSTKRY